ncbi:MAG: InlB B-repeat-containing protein [Bacteroidota bacterium]
MKKLSLFAKLLPLLFLFCFSEGWGQASLPLSRTAWGTEPTGWTNSGCTQRTTVFACSGNDGTTFDTNGDSRTIFFGSAPDQLVFKLKSSSMSGASSLLVQESVDGSTWSNIGTYGTAGGATAIADCGNITITLNCLSRYIKWTYTKGSGNCDMDDVSISSFVGSCGGCTTPATPPAPTAAANPACSIGTLSVGASTVSGVTWYWQTSASGTSTTQSTSSTYTTASTSTVYVRAQDNTGLCWSTNSSSLAITVNASPSVTLAPVSKTVCEGTTATFTASASGTTPIYQWQQNNGSGFTDIVSATSKTLTLSSVSLSMNSYSYQCVISVAGCSTISTTPVALIVISTPAMPPVPTTAIANPSCGSNTVVAMTSTVSGVNWYWEATSASTSTANSTSTQTVIASTSTVYAKAISAVAACASPASSLVATIGTQVTLTGAAQVKDICLGSSTTFTSSGSGTASKYWQYSSDGGATYTVVSVDGVHTGTNNATLNLNAPPPSLNGFLYQMVVNEPGCSLVTSATSTLNIYTVPSAPPTPSVIATCNMAVISETIVALPPAGVTWYWASNVTAPTSFTSAATDYSTTSSGTVYIRAKNDLAACWNSTGTTNSVVVNVVKSQTIITQPTNTTVCQGSSTSVSVSINTASTDPLTFQWQEYDGSVFNNLAANPPYSFTNSTYTSKLNIGNTLSIGTHTYQCIVSNACGTLTSNIVTVATTTAPVNDLCSNSSPIVIDAAPVSGNLNCAGPTSGLANASTKNDVWYAFTPTCTATHTVAMTFTTTGVDYDLYVYTTGSCPSSGSAGYISNGTTTVETISQTFTSGVTYYVRVLDFNNNGGTFSISVISNCGPPHTVTFDANGGLGSMSNQTANSATNLTANAFTNSGCTFVNWNDSANANGSSYGNSAIYSFTTDITLYAQWNCSSGGGAAGCPYLVSAVVNACGGSCNTEGKNEMVVMNTGTYSISVNSTNINLYYSGGSNHYFTNSFAASSGTVISNLNTLVATGGCTNTPFVFVPNGGTIPANSTYLILNNNSCFNGDFSAYCNTGPIYVIISTDVDWSISGYFGNNSTPRYFRTDFSNVNAGCGLTTYNYNSASTFSFTSDGASVVFNGTSPSYVNGTGNCAPNILILPIELLDFYGTQNGSSNDLIWKVASEKNVSHYIIEKSEDGFNFNELTRVNAIGAEGNLLTYSCEDPDPLSGVTYYRLSTLEKNQKINHYRIIDLDRGNKDWKSLIYQLNDQLFVEWKNYVPKNASITLFDLSGKQLADQNVLQAQTKISIDGFANGIYFIKISTPYKTENIKIVIQK